MGLPRFNLTPSLFLKLLWVMKEGQHQTRNQCSTHKKWTPWWRGAKTVTSKVQEWNDNMTMRVIGHFQDDKGGATLHTTLERQRREMSAWTITRQDNVYNVQIMFSTVVTGRDHVQPIMPTPGSTPPALIAGTQCVYSRIPWV
jgi:hypothetical protein